MLHRQRFCLVTFAGRYAFEKVRSLCSYHSENDETLLCCSTLSTTTRTRWVPSSCVYRLTVFIVAATEIFFDRKERNARSLNRNYLGDYCNLYERADLHKLIPRHERVDFSSYIYKYDRRFRRQGRYLIITNQALYIIEQDHVESPASFCIHRSLLCSLI